MTQVVLGSASAGRLRVLRQAGLDPLVLVSEVDEDALIDSLDADTPPEAVVAKLANAKAIAVAAQLPPDVAADCIVLGCDSMLFHNDVLCGKPGSAAAARQQWISMAGSTGYLLTGHALLRIADGVIAHTDSETATTSVHFGTPTDDELTAWAVGSSTASRAILPMSLGSVCRWCSAWFAALGCRSLTSGALQIDRT